MATKTSFVKLKGKTFGKTKVGDDFIEDYVCNRSGSSHSVSLGKRKTKESCKMGGHCSATMTVRCGKNVHVSFCSTHYSHELKLGNLRIPLQVKQQIVSDLTKGVKPSTILENHRSSIGTETINRGQIITQKDIANIERAHGLRVAERHHDDATSVKMMKSEYEGKDDPFLYCKMQGESEGILSSNDVFIVIMHPFQAKMLAANAHKFVCMDSTHGTNSYNFNLITLLVADEMYKGFAVAWCICNREDQFVLEKFLELVKIKVGNVSTKYFMSDDAEQYCNAWRIVFNDNSPKKLLCIWHVERAWNQKLLLIKDVQLRKQVYGMLFSLRTESNEGTFSVLCDELKNDLLANPDTLQFAVYFIKYYLNRPEQWAACHRLAAGVNTNMYVEAFHKQLKYQYLDGKCNKRVDRLIHVLLSYVRNKGVERLIDLEKGTQSSTRMHEVERRHRASLELTFESVKEDDNSYAVTSSTKSNVYRVTVHLQQENCTSCKLQCKDCQICIHSFTCSCPDAVVRGLICKHAHLVARYVQNKANCSSSNAETCLTASNTPPCDDVGVEDILESIGNADKSATVDSGKERMTILLTNIAEKRELLTDNDVISDANKTLAGLLNRLSSAISSNLPQASTSPGFTIKQFTPSNKKIEKQRSFYSTKKKAPKKPRLQKPTQEEQHSIKSNLLGTCAYPSSMQVSDHTYTCS